MTNNFAPFGKAVADQFKKMSAEPELYKADIDNDWLWDMYLGAFPEGSNPIHVKRTEHDCACCRQFVKNIGAAVTIKDGKVTTVWDAAESLPYPYGIVAHTMANAIRQKNIRDVFRTKFPSFGAESTVQHLGGSEVIRWNHFHGAVPAKFKTDRADTIMGEARTSVHVFRRGLLEIPAATVQDVLDLIESKALYRGEEHQKALQAFATLQLKWAISENQHAFVWENYKTYGAMIRNTVIGSLLIDLAEGKPLEAAVKSFEAKVAPANYKRPTALITPRMIDAALKTIEQLGYEPALQRRHATLKDITINNVLFADNAARGKMKDGTGLRASLMAEAQTTAPDFSKARKVPIQEFMDDVLPKAKSIQAYVENKHLPSFVSLTTAVDPDAASLFKWDNPFAWSYNGDVTDSDLRAKVQELGGRVDGVLRFSHTWNYDGQNQSLMDLHVFLPGWTSIKDGKHDHYGNHMRVGWNARKHTATGGVQDVDYTQPPGKSVPVENITFPTMTKLPEGKYIFKIHNWNFRSPTTSGFRAEIELNGEVYQYEYAKALQNKEWITVAEATLKNGVFAIEHKLDSRSAAREEWGIKTLALVPVTTVMYSPNHWDGMNVGNRHWFFMLKDCLNPQPVRGFYNEFLRPSLEEHRKVFEILGGKTKAPFTSDQLSGIGFSSTRRAELSVIVNIDGKSQPLTIQF